LPGIENNQRKTRTRTLVYEKKSRKRDIQRAEIGRGKCENVAEIKKTLLLNLH
jgi:hypothetical protein